MSILLNQLSRRFHNAYLSVDELFYKQFLPLKIQKHLIGWVSPASWAYLAHYPNIFQLQKHSIALMPNIHAIELRDDVFKKTCQTFVLEHHIKYLSGQSFELQSPLGDSLLHPDSNIANLLGMQLPLLTLTPFYKDNGQLFFCLKKMKHKLHVFSAQVVSQAQVNNGLIAHMCNRHAINQGIAMWINQIQTRRLNHLGVFSQKTDNYVIELPKDFILQNFNQADDVILSGQQLIEHMEHLKLFHFETSLIVASILTKFNHICVLSDGMRCTL